MSKNNRHYETRPATPVEEETIEETVEVVEEPTPVEEPVVEEVLKLTGVVANCKMLNIRETPDKNAAVVAIISEGATVEIDSEVETSDWYGVWLENGINGFCMKDYIAINP